ncbi:MAG TPA: hypothetical protein VFX28_04660, partial [Methylomirabilota bacterium]|nr:hypothetical protein [Methylomirabilota bacterium]
TALDTNGYYGDRLGDADLETIDLVLLDLKAWDEGRHRRLTGMDNAPTLEFARRLAARRKPVWVRFVLVPGLTDDPENIGRIARFVAPMQNVEWVEVLPFHQMGAFKWQSLGLEYRLADTPTPTEAQVQAALAHQARARVPLGQALIALGHLAEEELRDALCTQLHINFFDLDPVLPDRELRGLINEKFAARHLLVPLFRTSGVVVVAMDDPTRVGVIQELETMLGLEVEVVTSTTAKIRRAFDRLYGPPAPLDPEVLAGRNILVGALRDPRVAELAAAALRVKVLPPAWR